MSSNVQFNEILTQKDNEIKNLKAKIAKLEAKNGELEAKNAELEAKNAKLEAERMDKEKPNAKYEDQGWVHYICSSLYSVAYSALSWASSGEANRQRSDPEGYIHIQNQASGFSDEQDQNSASKDWVVVPTPEPPTPIYVPPRLYSKPQHRLLLDKLLKMCKCDDRNISQQESDRHKLLQVVPCIIASRAGSDLAATFEEAGLNRN